MEKVEMDGESGEEKDGLR